MTKKERFLTTINHEEPDRVPMDARFTPEARWNLINHFNLTEKYGEQIKNISTNGPEVDLLAIEMNHDFIITHLGPICGYYQHRGVSKYVDDFGIVRKWIQVNNAQAYTEIVEYPLTTHEAVEAYKLPDMTDERLYNTAREVITQCGEEFGIMAGIPCTLFELAWYLRGLDQFLMDLAADKDFVHYYLNKLKEWALIAGNMFAKLGVDVIWIGDDVGIQKQMMIAPNTWREFIKPIYEEFFTSWKTINCNVKVALHTDGFIEPIIGDLIEIGCDILNPIQSMSMDPEIIKKKYGNQLVMWGTVDNQYVMPFGTPDDVEEEVKLRLRTCAKGGGLIISPTHRIQPQTSVESMLRFYDTVKKYGTYPIKN